ncbi:transglycosylase domain-containing protein, partial [Actinomyces sp.]
MAQSHTRFVRPAQLVALLLSFLAASTLVGVVSAGVLVPAVGTGAITAKAGMEIFDEIPTDIQVVTPATESTMLDTNGQVIARFYDKQRIVIPSDKIAPIMKKAIVAIEDRRFFEHHGVDPTGIARAMVNNLGDDGGKQGASTITQQYVRNALAEKGYMEGDADQVEAATEQTTERKLREIKYALAVEKQMDKDQILSGYLNIAPFGPITYGVEAASRLYFSKSANELTIGEAALLAGLVQSPVQYNPLQHPEAAQERRNIVLSVMADQGVITEAEEAEAKAVNVTDMLHPTQIREGCSGAGDENAYFCSYAVRQFLADSAFGKTSIERERLLKTGGLTIRTTLDPKKQHAAYEALTKTIPSDDASGLDDALVSLVPQTGEVVAMAQNTVYGVGEDETMSNYAADGSFQVGSTFKVFVLAEWYKEGRSGYETIDGRTYFPNGSFKCDGAPVHTESWNVVDLAGKDGAFNVIGATGISVNHSFVNMASKLDFCDIFQVAADMGIDDGNGEPILAVPGNILGSGSASPL